MNLPKALAAIVDVLEKEKPTKPSQIVSIVKKSDVNKEDLMPYADFEHPGKDSYGRKMVYKGENYEIMVMSWKQGDFSAIHDHGHTMWGAVKIFGKAEHATFRWEDEDLSTLARWQVKEGDVLGVGHSLVHQMGNSDQEPFLSLHIYGHIDPQDNITGEARIFDLHNLEIQRVNGGAFFNLKEDEIVKKQEGPKADFATELRFHLESYKRMLRADDPKAEEYYQYIFDPAHIDPFIVYLQEITDAETDKVNHSIQWKILKRELREAAAVQATHDQSDQTADTFHKYAEVYDRIIGHSCLDSFMERYIDFFVTKYGVDFAHAHTLSIGCGTGLVEERIISKYNLSANQIYGIDLSESMIVEAKKRIHADVGDLLTLDPAIRKWDLAYSGLNVYQYLPHEHLEEAIRRTADILNEGGYFLGDFITPDHIRWYPNVIYGPEKKVVSIRTPVLIEENGASFQESEIVNINTLEGKMHIHHAGKHKRFLAPVFRIRSYFEKYFKSVELYDAVDLKLIEENDDSCASTRYIVVSRK